MFRKFDFIRKIVKIQIYEKFLYKINYLSKLIQLNILPGFKVTEKIEIHFSRQTAKMSPENSILSRKKIVSNHLRPTPASSILTYSFNFNTLHPYKQQPNHSPKVSSFNLILHCWIFPFKSCKTESLNPAYTIILNHIKRFLAKPVVASLLSLSKKSTITSQKQT